MKGIDGLLSFAHTFHSEESCIEYFEKLRWNGNVVSPYDKTSKVYKCKNHKYRCKNTGRYFDVKTGTVFANTKLPMRYWFYAMFLFLDIKEAFHRANLLGTWGLHRKRLGRCCIKSGCTWNVRTITSYLMR